MKKLISFTVVLSLMLTFFVPFTALADGLKLESGYYIIDSTDDFLKINDMSANYKITADIELPENFTPIGTVENPFKGKIIGRLKNTSEKPTLTVNLRGKDYVGLIGYMENGTINSLIIKGNIISLNPACTGAVAGFVRNGKIKDCINYANIISSYDLEGISYTGGIIGYAEAPEVLVINNCENYANITVSNETNGAVGGIVGGIFSSISQVSDCKNEGEISANSKYVGGIAGISHCEIKYSANKGKVTSLKNDAAGICPKAFSEISFSFNEGDVYALNNAGGISVYGSCNVTYNTGKITGESSFAVTNSDSLKNSYTLTGKLESKGNNYFLSDSKISENVLSEKEFADINNFVGFNEYYEIDTEGSYKYPQIIGNLYGTMPKKYIPFEHNRIIVEAENCTVSTPYFIDSNSKASNGEIVKCTTGAKSDASLIDEEALSYEFYLPEDSKCFLWISVLAKSTGGDSAFATFNDDDWTMTRFTVAPDEFLWYRVAGSDLKEGVNKIKLYPREYNMEVDKILITNKSTVIPAGTGEYAGEKSEVLLFKMPSFAPTTEHPRLWFVKEDIPAILNNLSHPEHAQALSTHYDYLNNNKTGKLSASPSSTVTNYDATVLEKIKAHAFEYAIKGDKEQGEKAVTMLEDFLNTLVFIDTDDYNAAGRVVYGIGLVYDWCYDLLTDKQKEFFIENGLFIAGSYTETGWPPVHQNGWGGHGSEDQFIRDLLAFSIAVYNEKPYVFDTVVGRLEEEFLSQRRDLFYNAHKSMFGSGYGPYRLNADVSAMFMLSKVNGGRNFWQNDEIQYMPYYYIYATRPDSFYFMEGDGRYAASTPKGIRRPDYLYIMLANYYKDGYLKYMFMEESETMTPPSYLEFLIVNDPELKPISKENLPLSKYFPYPAGHYIARTGWDMGKSSPDAMVSMGINEAILFDHNHSDAGEFEIYYKGALATDTGYYQTTRDSEYDNYFGSSFQHNYYRQTIAHNCMLIYDPDEPTSNFNHNGTSKEILNSGGQLTSNAGLKYSYPETAVNIKENEGMNRAKVLGHEQGPDEVVPEYTYLKGDLNNSYSEKVIEYERSFMFLNLKEDYPEIPGVLIVFDHVVSSNKDFKKTYLLHGINAPEIDGTRTTLKRTENGYNGKLTNETLLPYSDNVTITQIGEQADDFIIGDRNFKTYGVPGANNEAGGIRTEISPVTPSEEDFFLNVMQMSDADSDANFETTLIETDTHKGVKIADRVVLFGNTKDRLSDNVSFAFSGEGTYKITVADLKEGTWNIIKDGNITADLVVTEDGGVGAFEGEEGDYTLTYKNENSQRPQISYQHEFIENKIKIRVNDIYVYSDEPPVMENDRVLVPLRTIADVLSAETKWDETSNSAIIIRHSREIKVTADSNIAYIGDKEASLDVPAKIINSRIYVPVRFISEAFRAKVSWNDVTKTVILSDNVNAPAEGYIDVYDCFWDAGVIMGDSTNGFDTLDNNPDTYWATGSAEEGARYIAYDFGESKIINEVEILWGNPHKRYFSFDILVSNDNENWKTLLEGQTSELVTFDKSNDYQTAKLPYNISARYIKIVCYGNDKTFANNIKEIRFK